MSQRGRLLAIVALAVLPLVALSALDIAQRLELREEGGELLFGVRDCGIGIPASEVEAVFAENYREANLAYLEKNLGKLRSLAIARRESGQLAGFALGHFMANFMTDAFLAPNNPDGVSLGLIALPEGAELVMQIPLQ